MPLTRRLVWLALGGILLLAGGLRLARLDSVPPGLWFDEALNGQDAARVWAPPEQGGGFKLVYPDEFPREPMYETLLALAVGAGGPRVAVLRTVSALVGLAAVLLLFGMLRREAGTGVALGAAAMLGVMRWHIIFSRLVFRTIILAPWLAGLVWAALAWRRRPSWARAAALGLMFGGGFYTYLAWYFMAPLLVALAGWLGWEAWRRRLLTHVALAAAVGALVVAPLAVHYAAHPADLMARPGAVSVFSQGPAQAIRQVARNAAEAALMFHWRGDHVPKHNIPWRPALDTLQGLLMLAGLAVAVRRIVRGGAGRALWLIVLGWIACGLLATVLTVTDSPNFLRTLCITPAVAALTGLGLATVAGGIARLTRRPAAGWGLAVALVLVSAAWSGWDVYGQWARRPDVWQSFNGDMAGLARVAGELPEGDLVFVPAFLAGHRTFQFLTLGHTNIHTLWRLGDPASNGPGGLERASGSGRAAPPPHHRDGQQRTARAAAGGRPGRTTGRGPDGSGG